LGFFVRDRVETVLLLPISAAAWLFGNTFPDARFVKRVELRSKRIIAPAIERIASCADQSIEHRTNFIIL